jgi:YfiH family protein
MHAHSTSNWTHQVTKWPHAIAGFTARGDYDVADPASGFNLGHTPSADPAEVAIRRQQALAELGIPDHQLVLSDQVHGTRVTVAQAADIPHLDQRFGTPYYPESDGLITAETGLALMLIFADCCPVWLYCPDPLCGGAVHCGWRGTVADMAGTAVAALHHAFGAAPESMHAVVGPSICQSCYEVGAEVVAAVQSLDAMETVILRDNRTHLDLPRLNALLLRRRGLHTDNIRVVDSCTRCGPVPLYSWRRDGKATGRMAGFFALL